MLVIAASNAQVLPSGRSLLSNVAMLLLASGRLGTPRTMPLLGDLLVHGRLGIDVTPVGHLARERVEEMAPNRLGNNRRQVGQGSDAAACQKRETEVLAGFALQRNSKRDFECKNRLFPSFGQL
jgi:hypothetical protein